MNGDKIKLMTKTLWLKEQQMDKDDVVDDESDIIK